MSRLLLGLALLAAAAGPASTRLRVKASPAVAPCVAAVVPLSLAGSLPATRLDVPPLTARALGVRASPRKDAIRAFLAFLAGETGNAAFRACGRTDAR